MKMGEFIERLMKSALATPESIATRIVKTMEESNPRLRIPATMDAYFLGDSHPCYLKKDLSG